MNLLGPYTMDFDMADDEACGKYKVLYAVFDLTTGRLLKDWLGVRPGIPKALL